jgi:hypothetical protein
MSNRNPRNFETLKNNKKIFNVVGFIFGALIAFVAGLAGIGMMFSAEKSSGKIGGGFLAAIGIGGGIYLSILADNELTTPKNEKKCKSDEFNIYENVKIPAKYISADEDYEIELDVPEYETGRKVQVKGYGGVFLKSNLATESVGGNFDAIFIPAGAKAVVLKDLPPYMSTATADTKYKTKDFYDRLYVMRRGTNKVTVKLESSKSPIPAMSTIPTTVCYDPVESDV